MDDAVAQLVGDDIKGPGEGSNVLSGGGSVLRWDAIAEVHQPDTGRTAFAAPEGSDCEFNQFGWQRCRILLRRAVYQREDGTVVVIEPATRVAFEKIVV